MNSITRHLYSDSGRVIVKVAAILSLAVLGVIPVGWDSAQWWHLVTALPFLGAGFLVVYKFSQALKARTEPNTVTRRRPRGTKGYVWLSFCRDAGIYGGAAMMLTAFLAANGYTIITGALVLGCGLGALYGCRSYRRKGKKIHHPA